MCVFKKLQIIIHIIHTQTHTHLSLSTFLSKISQSKQFFFSETTSSTTTTETEHNTTHRKLSSDPHFFPFTATLYIHLFEKRFLGFREKKKCIPKWIQPNPITYRVFFFASTSTAKQVVCHFWLQLFLSLSLHLCLLISVVVVFF